MAKRKKGTKRRLADLYIVGIGIHGRRHLTWEAENALRESRIVLDETGQIEMTKELNPNTVDMAPLYWTGEEREVVYERLVKRALDEIEIGPGVAVVTYGHPLFFDDINHQLLRRCRRRKLDCVIVPGISCLDTLSVDLEIDYGDGLQVYEATDLVDNGYPLNPHVHTLILQLGEFNHSETSDTLDPAPGRLKKLVAFLRKTYRRDQKVVICYSNDGSEGLFLKTRLHRLDSHWRKIFPGTTLYVPPAEI